MMYNIVKNGCMLLWAFPEPTLLVLNGSQSSIPPVIVQAVAGWAATEQLVAMAALTELVPLLVELPSLALFTDAVELGRL
jgi:hypothetical protein